MNYKNMHIEELKDKIYELDRVSQIIETNKEKIDYLNSNNVIKAAGYIFIQMFNSILYDLLVPTSDIYLYLAILNHLTWAFIGSIFYGTFYSNLMNVHELKKENQKLALTDLANQKEIEQIKEVIANRLEEAYASEEDKMYQERISDLQALKFSLLNSNVQRTEKTFVYRKVK